MKPSCPLNRPTASIDGISIDFNPRDLIVKYDSQRTADLRSQLQAIYVPTKGRIQHVNELLESLNGHHAPVFLLPSFAEDIPPGRLSHVLSVQNLSFRKDSTSLSVMRSFRSASNPLFTTSSRIWDLPLKRNYALWHALKNRFSRILLLDDDIRGLNDAVYRAGSTALSRWALAGAFIDEFPDTSVIGHVESAVGERVLPFISGSCLFVRCDASIGFFPQIYNEDWIFMAPHISSGNICSIGSIRQKPYDPFRESSLSEFQEPGEIIADGLFALLASDRYDDRFDESVWIAILSNRRNWLTILSARTENPVHHAAIEAARALCERVRGVDCAEYINDLEHDRQTWNRRLEELA